MIMCMFKFVAVSNWELYQSFHGNRGMEEYTDYLAQLAVSGKQRRKPELNKVKVSESVQVKDTLEAPEKEKSNRIKPDILIVREKNLTESEYVKLFTSLWEKCKSNPQGKDQAVIIPHTYFGAAEKTGSSCIHLPLPLLRRFQSSHSSNQNPEDRVPKLKIGVSVHSLEEAREAERLGASYVTAGHIFTTDCKKGVPPRGIEFLEQVCAGVNIPVYAIGGIHMENISLVQNTKAAGACMMSEFMQ